MAHRYKTFVDRIDFSKGNTTVHSVMAVFIKVAKRYPNQANALLEKYVAFVKLLNPEWTDEKSRNVATNNIITMAGHYDAETLNLLLKTYTGLRQHC